jgi:hypothetical protein
MPTNNSRLAYIVILLGFLFRLAYVQFISPISSFMFSDMANYVQVADLIQKGEWRATHFFQPIGFPYLILFLKSNFSNWMQVLEWIQILLSTATLYLFWKTAKESFGEKLGLISLCIASIHLPWIAFNGLALSECVFIFLLSILAWFTLKLVRENKSLYAVLWTLTFFSAFLFKGTHIFFGPLFVLTMFYFYRKTRLKHLLIISIIMGSGLLAHGMFTQSKINHFQISASAGGLNFVEGKCPIKNNADSNGYSWLSPLYHQLDLNKLKRWDHPFTDSSFFMKEGFKCIKDNPLVLIQSLEGIPFLFLGNTLWPANQSKIANEMRLYELFFSCFCLVGLVVFVRFLRHSNNIQEEVLVWVLPIASVMLCVYIFKSEIRFRIPFDVWIIPVAVKGWDVLFKSRLA